MRQKTPKKSIICSLLPDNFSQAKKRVQKGFQRCAAGIGRSWRRRTYPLEMAVLEKVLADTILNLASRRTALTHGLHDPIRAFRAGGQRNADAPPEAR